jgi:hypothetical protein
VPTLACRLSADCAQVETTLETMMLRTMQQRCITACNLIADLG